MEQHFYIYVVIMLHTGFAAALLHWQQNERFSRLFAGAWLIEAVRAAILLPEVHSIGGVPSAWYALAEVLNVFPTWMLFASAAELTGRRTSHKLMLLYFGISIPIVLFGRFAGPTLLASWFEVTVPRAEFLAVFINLVILFVPVTIARTLITIWLFSIWRSSRLEGALIAFAFGVPYALVAIAVPVQYYFSWYPAVMQYLWCLRVFGFSMGIFMLIISRSEEARRKGDALFRTLFEQAAIGVAYVESGSGVIRQVNQRFAELVNETVDGLANGTIDQFVNAADLQEREWSGHSRDRDFSVEKRFDQADGSVVWGNLTVSPMSLQGEELSAWIVIIEEVTQRKLAIDALQDHAQRLEFALEVGQMGTFTVDARTQDVLLSGEHLRLHGYESGHGQPDFEEAMRR